MSERLSQTLSKGKQIRKQKTQNWNLTYLIEESV